MIRFVSHSEVGGHLKNEDFWAVQPFLDDREGYTCAVADGQGGRSGGARAAELACRTCQEIAATYQIGKLQSPEVWTDVIRKADNAVSIDPDAGYTTLIVFGVTHEWMSGASCGDSAVVLHDPQRHGEILTARQFKNPPVGSGAAVAVPFFVQLMSPWTLLAMSDGVWKYSGWESILNLDPVARVEEIVATSLARARLRNGKLQDDFTLVAFQLTPDGCSPSGQ
jgi:hypothetical protein